MNWEAVGAIGNVVGAIGVTVTLIYLIIQIKQNNRLLRLNTANVVTEELQAMFSLLASDKARRRAGFPPEPGQTAARATRLWVHTYSRHTQKQIAKIASTCIKLSVSPRMATASSAAITGLRKNR